MDQLSLSTDLDLVIAIKLHFTFIFSLPLDSQFIGTCLPFIIESTNAIRVKHLWPGVDFIRVHHSEREANLLLIRFRFLKPRLLSPSFDFNEAINWETGLTSTPETSSDPVDSKFEIQSSAS